MPEIDEKDAPRFKTFAPFTDDELRALDSAHGNIRVVRGATPEPKRWQPDDVPEPPWELVFRAPTSSESEFFERHLHGNSKDMALRDHAKATIVGVSLAGRKTLVLDKDAMKVKVAREAFDGLRKRFGLAHIASNDALMSLAGMVAAEEGKE